MPNVRSQGYNSHVLLKREATPGTSPGGNFIKVPFNSTNLSKKRGYVDDPLAGIGRDPLNVFMDANNVGGDLVVPVDMRNIGYYLTGLLGNPTTAEDTGVYTHTFVSGKDTELLPSYSIEVGHGSVPAYFLYLMSKVNSLGFNFERAGPAAVSVGLMAQAETKHSTTQGGTPTSLVLARASHFNGAIKSDDTLLANIVSGSLNLSNNMQAVENLTQDGNIAGIDAGMFSATGSLNARFASATLLDAATAGTPVDLEFSYTLDDDLKLIMKVHEVYLDKTAVPIEGPGGVSVELPFRAVKNTSAGEAFEAILTNNLAGTTYTS